MPIVLRIDKKIGIFVSALSIAAVSILSYSSAVISYGFAGICVMALFFSALTNHWDDYLVLYLLFLGLSLEYAVFVGEETFYSLKNIRIAGLNLGIWMLLPIWVGVMLNHLSFGKIKRRYPFFWTASRDLIIINIIAGMMGILMLIVNDNGILNSQGWLSSYIEIFYMHTLIPFSVFACLLIVLSKDGGIDKVVEKGTMALQACLWGTVFQLIISRLFHIYGNYDGLNTLMSSAVSTFLPFMVLLSFYKENVYFKKLNFALALVGLLLAFLFNSGGKLFILLFLVLVILFFYFINKKNIIMKLIPTALVIVGAFVAAWIISNMANANNVLLGSKLSQTLSMVQFWRPNWLKNMDLSPRLRFAEFANVFIEYSKKPWFIITGKGFGGTIKDHTGFFFGVPQYMKDSGFSAKQWNNGLFYELHEIVSSVLIYGFPWILFFIGTVKRTLKCYKVFPWFILGAYWILVYYGYSFTITTFGAIAYFIGALEINNSEYVQ